MKEISKEHNVKKDVATLDYKKLMAFIISENFFQNSENTPSHTSHHSIRELT